MNVHDWVIIEISWFPDPEYTYEEQTGYQRLTGNKLWNTITEAIEHLTRFSECTFPETADDAAALLSEWSSGWYDGGARYYTEEGYAKHEAEEERKKLEARASSIAKAEKVSVSTVEFLKAIDERLDNVRMDREDWDSEGRYFHMAACAAAYGGSRGVEIFSDDQQFTTGRWRSEEVELRAIKRWLSQECPLLYARYEESKLALSKEED